MIEIVVCLFIIGLCGLLQLPRRIINKIQEENRLSEIKKAQKIAEEHETAKKEQIRKLLNEYHELIEEIANRKAEIKYMTDENKVVYAQRYIDQLTELKNQIKEELTDELLED